MLGYIIALIIEGVILVGLIVTIVVLKRFVYVAPKTIDDSQKGNFANYKKAYEVLTKEEKNNVDDVINHTLSTYEDTYVRTSSYGVIVKYNENVLFKIRVNAGVPYSYFKSLESLDENKPQILSFPLTNSNDVNNVKALIAAAFDKFIKEHEDAEKAKLEAKELKTKAKEEKIKLKEEKAAEKARLKEEKAKAKEEANNE